MDAFRRDSISTFVHPFSTDGKETKMYMNLSTQTLNVRSLYVENLPKTEKTGQIIDSAKSLSNKETDSPQQKRSFSDILSIEAQNRRSVDSIEAYIMETVNSIFDKIAEQTGKNFKSQYSEVSITSVNISIEIAVGEGENLQDVQNELDSMLSDDGYWGVEKTSQRMFDFAHSLVGDNPTELEKAKEAVVKGFEQTKAMFGGELPQISHDTFDATMEKFDNYISQLNNSVSAYA